MESLNMPSYKGVNFKYSSDYDVGYKMAMNKAAAMTEGKARRLAKYYGSPGHQSVIEARDLAKKFREIAKGQLQSGLK
jgi:hypothetical protein